MSHIVIRSCQTIHFNSPILSGTRTSWTGISSLHSNNFTIDYSSVSLFCYVMFCLIINKIFLILIPTVTDVYDNVYKLIKKLSILFLPIITVEVIFSYDRHRDTKETIQIVARSIFLIQIYCNDYCFIFKILLSLNLNSINW